MTVAIKSDTGGTFGSLQVAGVDKVKIDSSNGLVVLPPASATPSINGEMVFQLTSNTSLVIKIKGSDGVVRSATLTLS